VKLLPGDPVVGGAVQIIAAIVEGVNSSRDVSSALARAETALVRALQTSDARVEFLEALAAEYHAGRLEKQAHDRLLVAALRVLKSSQQLSEECLQIVRRAQEGR
jgi:phage protein D